LLHNQEAEKRRQRQVLQTDAHLKHAFAHQIEPQTRDRAAQSRQLHIVVAKLPQLGHCRLRESAQRARVGSGERQFRRSQVVGANDVAVLTRT
jgi:hypothetical protein